MNYKLWIEGEAKGPCTLEDLRVMWEEGDIDGETLYAEEGSNDFKPLSGLAGVLKIDPALVAPAPAPATPDAPSAPPVAAATSTEKTYRIPIPVYCIYLLGVMLAVSGIFLLASTTNKSAADGALYFQMILTGIGILFTGYLYDLLAQCLFELKEANRLLRKK